MKKYGIAIVIAMISIILVGCGGKKEPKPEAVTVDVSDAEKVGENEVIAIINGEEIKGDLYNTIYLQKKTELISKGNKDVSPEEVKQETIDAIINDTLTLHLGKKEGIVITDEEVEEGVKDLKRIGREGYDSLLNQFNYTEESIAYSIRVEMTRGRYIDQNIEVTVTEEEIEKMYEEVYERVVVEEGKEIPEYIDSKEQLRSVIRIEKSKAEAQKALDAFKETVDIEINI